MMRPPARLGVFAVETTSAQLTWSRLGPGRAQITWAGGSRSIETDGGPGSCHIDGLRPDDDQIITITGARLAEPAMLRVRTLADPPGEELYRFATVSDIHLGTDHFGLRGTIVERHATVPHPIRCTQAALDEALAWGAQRIVVKGDTVHSSRPHTWAAAGELFGSLPVPVDLILGNHEVNQRSTVDALVAAGRNGLRLHTDVESIDIPGLRLVLFDSSFHQIDIGRWNHLRGPVCDALAEANGAAMMFVHHQPQPFAVPIYLPRGIPAPSARRFLRAARAANPDIIGSSGHTHRHRRYVASGVPWVETGSPKDYPGTWTGYVVHEGGVRQVVHRVGAPDCIGWTEHTRRAALGAWGWWAPGTLDDRCFTHVW